MCVQVFVCLCVLCFYLYVKNWYCHYAFAIVKNENVYMRVLIKKCEFTATCLKKLGSVGRDFYEG